MRDMKILPFDDSIVGSMNNVTKKAYIDNKDNYSIVPFREDSDPSNAWAMPYITGYKYKIHWFQDLDFTQMQMTLSPRWEATDKDVYFIFNFTDVRAKVDFIIGNEIIKNETIKSTDPAVLQTGANIVYNDTAVREIHLLANGKNASRNNLVMKGYRCIGSCITDTVETQVVEDTVRLWSEASSWTAGRVPAAGEDVVIEPGKNFVFDLAESPIYNYLQINGRVTFK